MDSIKFTTAEKKIIDKRFDLLDPEKVWTNRESFYSQRTGGPDFSYSTIQQLIRKGALERVNKAYHAFARIQYKWTKSFIEHQIKEWGKDEAADQYNYERQNGDFETY